MFEITAEGIVSLYGDLISGNPLGTIVAVSAGPLSEAAVSALEKSIAALKLGDGNIAYVRTQLGDGTALGSNDLFTIVEGLDPLICIIADDAGADLMERAFRATIARNARNRLFGRTTITFQDLNSMLDTSEHKQQVWALLKSIAGRRH